MNDDGYRRSEHVAALRLTFEDDTMTGLVVRMTHVSVDRALAVDELLEDGIAYRPENRARLMQLAEWWAEACAGWNAQRADGTPIPATAEGLLSHDKPFVSNVIRAWTAAMAGLLSPEPEAPSTSGDTPDATALATLARLPAVRAS